MAYPVIIINHAICTKYLNKHITVLHQYTVELELNQYFAAEYRYTENNTGTDNRIYNKIFYITQSLK